MCKCFCAVHPSVGREVWCAAGKGRNEDDENGERRMTLCVHAWVCVVRGTRGKTWNPKAQCAKSGCAWLLVPCECRHTLKWRYILSLREGVLYCFISLVICVQRDMSTCPLPLLPAYPFASRIQAGPRCPFPQIATTKQRIHGEGPTRGQPTRPSHQGIARRSTNFRRPSGGGAAYLLQSIQSHVHHGCCCLCPCCFSSPFKDRPFTNKGLFL